MSKTLIDQSLDKWMDRNTWEHEKIYENYIGCANRCDLGSYFNQQAPKNVTNSALAVAGSSSKYCDSCAYVPTIFQCKHVEITHENNFFSHRINNFNIRIRN